MWQSQIDISFSLAHTWMESHSHSSQRSPVAPWSNPHSRACRKHMNRSRMSNYVKKREQRLKVYWTTTDVMLFNAQALSPILHFCYSVSVDFCLKLFMCLLCNDRSCHVLIWRDLGWRLLKLLLLPICTPPPPPPMYTHWSLDCVISRRWSGMITGHKLTCHSNLLHNLLCWFLFFCFLRGHKVGSGSYATFGNLTFGYTISY